MSRGAGLGIGAGAGVGVKLGVKVGFVTFTGTPLATDIFLWPGMAGVKAIGKAHAATVP